jgi:hypothetical protein
MPGCIGPPLFGACIDADRDKKWGGRPFSSKLAERIRGRLASISDRSNNQ